ncbi:unnamed protein product [Hymenolepis diminuta]|uniref:B box-type domain-containing protein n=1 Tax=Hymenolepis diminuta TaxID=6216 RepID=A0A0R3SQ18_HYMDI|nr:unnamed protein product [Hymenolepis diminuta]VUZ44369.1 unnamed protein product [Hymenolepis diminuta]
MGPSYSDVDETLESVPTYESLSNFEYESISAGSRTIIYETETSEGQDPQAIPDANILRHQSFPRTQNARRPTDYIHPERQRKSSEISDFTYSDSEDRNSQESLDSIQNARLSGDNSEVESHRTIPNDLAPPTCSLQRITRPRHNKSLSSSGFSDVDEFSDSSSENRCTKSKTNKTNEGTEDKPNSSQIRKRRHRRKRAIRTYPMTSESPYDFDISTSDIDENLRNANETNVPEGKIKEDEETNVVDLNTESENSEEDWASAGESQFFDVEGVKKCDLCCDIDVKVKRCKLCERAFCEGCSDQHFDTHAAELTARLQKLIELALSIQKELPQNRLKAEIDDAVEELVTASNKALQRACDVYQAASLEYNTFIGSLVDRRIKISASTKYLIKRIPVVLFSEDLCELQYFQKVYKSVRERLAELSIAIKDPRSKGMERLALTSTFSSNGPFLGPNNLLILLGDLDCFQSYPEAQ